MTITPISDEALAAIKQGLQVYGPRLDHRTEIRVADLRALIYRLEQAETDRLTWYEIAKMLSRTPPDPPLWVRAGNLKGTE
jgi:hypothetical protein